MIICKVQSKYYLNINNLEKEGDRSVQMSDCNASFESGIKDENEDGSTTSTNSDIQNDKNRNAFQQSLDLKLKTLNEGALLKKRSPMEGNYFRKSEEFKDQEFLNVSVTITSKQGNKFDTRQLFLKYELKRSSLIFTENCLSDDISLTIDLKNIHSIRLTFNELLITTDLY